MARPPPGLGRAPAVVAAPERKLDAPPRSYRRPSPAAPWPSPTWLTPRASFRRHITLGFATLRHRPVHGAGLAIGNALAFVFPIPEVFKAIKGGKVAVPAWRAGILVSASLALGLVNATVAGMPLWGIQNIFAATVMLLAWPAARWGKKAAGDAGHSPKKSATATAVNVAGALAVAAAMYFAAAAVVPAAIAAVFGAAAVANVTLGIMALTGAAFFLLFLPDIISIARGRAPQGFTGSL